jgi:acetyl-CoA acetyltransferase
MKLLRQPVIAGIGETEYSRNSGRSELQLAAEASHAAIRDAGLSPADVDGLVSYTMDGTDELELQRCLGMPLLRWAGRAPFGGVGCCASVQIAAAAVAAGYCEAVIVYRALNGRSSQRYGAPGWRAASGPDGSPLPDLHYAMGLDTGAKSYAAEMQHYLRRYGVTSEDLGRYVVSARAYAASNPRSMYYRTPMTLEEHQASRWIVEPWLRRNDCCLESDGGAAILVTSLDKARSVGRPSVNILAAAQAYDVYRSPEEHAAEKAALVQDLVRQSGIWPKDADVALIYDAFSPAVFTALEDFGICAAGEARHFIGAGETGLTGTMPVNPNGGLLGEAYVQGVNNIIEAVRQLRGEAANQVADAKTALVTGGGGLILGKT